MEKIFLQENIFYYLNLFIDLPAGVWIIEQTLALVSTIYYSFFLNSFPFLSTINSDHIKRDRLHVWNWGPNDCDPCLEHDPRFNKIKVLVSRCIRIYSLLMCYSLNA